MHNADHLINTFDWIMLAFLAAIMLTFILVVWVPALKEIQETIKFFALGLAFAIGRTVHHFLAGVVFALFDHPYDTGDRIELWSGQSKDSVSLFVVRQSLLYTVFRRVDSWMEMQVGNEFLQQCRIENVTRSGSNRQAVSMMIDIRTTFKDLSFLRSELEDFLKMPDNKRDYLPNLAMAIVGVHELNKLELRCIFTHRTNWSNEPLRAARSMRFMCALVAAIRKVPIIRPDGGPLGQEGRPLYNVMMSEQEASQKLAGFSADAAAARIDASSAAVVIDVSGIQRGEKDTTTTTTGSNTAEDDAARVRMAMEEADRKRAAQAAKDADELKAMAALTKPPAVEKKGPPPRETAGAGTSSAVDVGTTGLRSMPHFRG
jgi:small-conductance mechanosensitive channel